MTWSKVFRLLGHFFAILATAIWMCSCNVTGYTRIDYEKTPIHEFSQVITGTRYTLGYLALDFGAGESLEPNEEPRPLLSTGVSYRRGMIELSATVDVLEPWQTPEFFFYTSLELTY